MARDVVLCTWGVLRSSAVQLGAAGRVVQWIVDVHVVRNVRPGVWRLHMAGCARVACERASQPGQVPTRAHVHGVGAGRRLVVACACACARRRRAWIV